MAGLLQLQTMLEVDVAEVASNTSFEMTHLHELQKMLEAIGQAAALRVQPPVEQVSTTMY